MLIWLQFSTKWVISILSYSDSEIINFEETRRMFGHQLFFESLTPILDVPDSLKNLWRRVTETVAGDCDQDTCYPPELEPSGQAGSGHCWTTPRNILHDNTDPMLYSESCVDREPGKIIRIILKDKKKQRVAKNLNSKKCLPGRAMRVDTRMSRVSSETSHVSTRKIHVSAGEEHVSQPELIESLDILEGCNRSRCLCFSQLCALEEVEYSSHICNDMVSRSQSFQHDRLIKRNKLNNVKMSQLGDGTGNKIFGTDLIKGDKSGKVQNFENVEVTYRDHKTNKLVTVRLFDTEKTTLLDNLKKVSNDLVKMVDEDVDSNVDRMDLTMKEICDSSWCSCPQVNRTNTKTLNTFTIAAPSIEYRVLNSGYKSTDLKSSGHVGGSMGLCQCGKRKNDGKVVTTNDNILDLISISPMNISQVDGLLEPKSASNPSPGNDIEYWRFLADKTENFEIKSYIEKIIKSDRQERNINKDLTNVGGNKLVLMADVRDDFVVQDVFLVAVNNADIDIGAEYQVASECCKDRYDVRETIVNGKKRRKPNILQKSKIPKQSLLKKNRDSSLEGMIFQVDGADDAVESEEDSDLDNYFLDSEFQDDSYTVWNKVDDEQKLIKQTVKLTKENLLQDLMSSHDNSGGNTETALPSSDACGVSSSDGSPETGDTGSDARRGNDSGAGPESVTVSSDASVPTNSDPGGWWSIEDTYNNLRYLTRLRAREISSGDGLSSLNTKILPTIKVKKLKKILLRKSPRLKEILTSVKRGRPRLKASEKSVSKMTLSHPNHGRSIRSQRMPRVVSQKKAGEKNNFQRQNSAQSNNSARQNNNNTTRRSTSRSSDVDMRVSRVGPTRTRVSARVPVPSVSGNAQPPVRGVSARSEGPYQRQFTGHVTETRPWVAAMRERGPGTFGEISNSNSIQKSETLNVNKNENVNNNQILGLNISTQSTPGLRTSTILDVHGNSDPRKRVLRDYTAISAFSEQLEREKKREREEEARKKAERKRRGICSLIPLCEQMHHSSRLSTCSVFMDLSGQQKIDMVIYLGACRTCLGVGHNSEDCWSEKVECRFCGSFLHNDIICTKSPMFEYINQNPRVQALQTKVQELARERRLAEVNRQEFERPGAYNCDGVTVCNYGYKTNSRGAARSETVTSKTVDGPQSVTAGASVGAGACSDNGRQDSGNTESEPEVSDGKKNSIAALDLSLNSESSQLDKSGVRQVNSLNPSYNFVNTKWDTHLESYDSFVLGLNLKSKLNKTSSRRESERSNSSGQSDTVGETAETRVVGSDGEPLMVDCGTPGGNMPILFDTKDGEHSGKKVTSGGATMMGSSDNSESSSKQVENMDNSPPLIDMDTCLDGVTGGTCSAGPVANVEHQAVTGGAVDKGVTVTMDDYRVMDMDIDSAAPICTQDTVGGSNKTRVENVKVTGKKPSMNMISTGTSLASGIKKPKTRKKVPVGVTKPMSGGPMVPDSTPVPKSSRAGVKMGVSASSRDLQKKMEKYLRDPNRNREFQEYWQAQAEDNQLTWFRRVGQDWVPSPSISPWMFGEQNYDVRRSALIRPMSVDNVNNNVKRPDTPRPSPEDIMDIRSGVRLDVGARVDSGIPRYRPIRPAAADTDKVSGNGVKTRPVKLQPRSNSLDATKWLRSFAPERLEAGEMVKDNDNNQNQLRVRSDSSLMRPGVSGVGTSPNIQQSPVVTKTYHVDQPDGSVLRFFLTHEDLQTSQVDVKAKKLDDISQRLCISQMAKLKINEFQLGETTITRHVPTESGGASNSVASVSSDNGVCVQGLSQTSTSGPGCMGANVGGKSDVSTLTSASNNVLKEGPIKETLAYLEGFYGHSPPTPPNMMHTVTMPVQTDPLIRGDQVYPAPLIEVDQSLLTPEVRRMAAAEGNRGVYVDNIPIVPNAVLPAAGIRIKSEPRDNGYEVTTKKVEIEKRKSKVPIITID